MRLVEPSALPGRGHGLHDPEAAAFPYQDPTATELGHQRDRSKSMAEERSPFVQIPQPFRSIFANRPDLEFAHRELSTTTQQQEKPHGSPTTRLSRAPRHARSFWACSRARRLVQSRTVDRR